MSDKAKKKRHIKQIYWICDKKGCNTGNTRTLEANIVLNDDVCDYCHHRIHEPLLIDLNDEQH
jgi:hypothetical protein